MLLALAAGEGVGGLTVEERIVSLDVEGRSLGGRLCGRCGRVFFFPRFVESLRTPATMLRLFTGRIL